MKRNFFEAFYNIYSGVILGLLMFIGIMDLSFTGAALAIYAMILAFINFHPEFWRLK